MTFPVFTCPAALIFDETRQQCLNPEDTEPCQSSLAPYPTPQPPTDGVTDNNELPPMTTLVPPLTSTEITTGSINEEITSAGINGEITTESITEEASTEKVWELDELSLYPCPAPGYYPYESDCVRFYKCVETDEGKLTGQRYKCPGGFSFSEEREKCWPTEEVPPCQRVPEGPIIRSAPAIQLLVSDLAWFFN
ncbi:hypothetical protein Pmani_026754 [Petrolisthes manimaculis]|uniref:Chitin-binding type-2 domain-containing protein n=1 Tax=Petrolisthes manimaculis TaxID=1843537 RepID=A0AAE1TZT7_9EUCA|nr:hypothetical protein Pmani_026754 [Petrolisthes manimaculis]